jgi:hypothetical protein
MSFNLSSYLLPCLIPVLHFTGDRKLMGNFANGSAMKLAAWSLAVAMLAINVYLVFSSLPIPPTPINNMLIGMYMAVNYAFIGYLSKAEFREFAEFASNFSCFKSKFFTHRPKQKGSWLAGFNPEQQKEAEAGGAKRGVFCYGSFADDEGPCSLNAAPRAGCVVG